MKLSDYNGFRGGSRTCPQTDPAERAGLKLCAPGSSFAAFVPPLCPLWLKRCDAGLISGLPEKRYNQNLSYPNLKLTYNFLVSHKFSGELMKSIPVTIFN